MVVQSLSIKTKFLVRIALFTRAIENLPPSRYQSQKWHPGAAGGRPCPWCPEPLVRVPRARWRTDTPRLCARGTDTRQGMARRKGELCSGRTDTACQCPGARTRRVRALGAWTRRFRVRGTWTRGSGRQGQGLSDMSPTGGSAVPLLALIPREGYFCYCVSKKYYSSPKTPSRHTQLFYRISKPTNATKYQHKHQVQAEYNTHIIQMEFEFHLQNKENLSFYQISYQSSTEVAIRTKIPSFYLD